MSTLEVKNLHVSIDGKEILKGLDLKMQTGRSMQSWAQTELGSRLYQRRSWVTQLTRSLKVRSY